LHRAFAIAGDGFERVERSTHHVLT
jgi:hypothetical protein